MRSLFLIGLFISGLFLFTSGTAFCQSTSADSLKQRFEQLKDLQKSGDLNETEYRQLKEELLLSHYNFTGLNPLLKKQNKSASHITAGAILFPVGMGMFTLGLMKMNETVPEGEADVYAYRERINKRYGIGIMTSGWVVGIAGIYLVSKGIHLKRIVYRSKNKDASMSLGIGNSGELGLTLKF